ncbi:hypothetical protein N665_0035s0038 [Sinapis alba]|nr:hypothetical protein N665_0035s0038 [Sinapis alba]
MPKTRWGKKKKKTKCVQDITSPEKEVPLKEKTNKVGEKIPEEENENAIEKEVEENEESEEREEEVNSGEVLVEEGENKNSGEEEDATDSGEQEDAADSGEQEDARDEEEKEDSADEEEEEENTANGEEQENAANEDEQENAEMIPENNPSEETMDWEDEPTAIKPMSMYFPPTEYTKKIKISTRCFITDFMETMDELNPPVTRVEKSWFDNHPQFKHIFHMPKDGNHKVMGDVDATSSNGKH